MQGSEFDQKGFEELCRSNVHRLGMLGQMGIQIGGVSEGYIGRLLEYLVEQIDGPKSLDDLKLDHQLWLADQLDHHESEIRKQQLTFAGDASAFGKRV